MLWSYAMGSRGPSSISSTCESRWCPYLPAWIASLPTSLLGALSLSHSPSPSSSMPTEVSGALAPNRARLSVQSYKSCARLHRGGDRLPVCLPGMQSTALQALALGVQSTFLAVLTQRRASALTAAEAERSWLSQGTSGASMRPCRSWRWWRSTASASMSRWSSCFRSWLPRSTSATNSRRCASAFTRFL